MSGKVEPWMREAGQNSIFKLYDNHAIGDAWCKITTAERAQLLHAVYDAIAEAFAAHAKADGELREAFDHFVSCALTCEKSNPDSWMVYFAAEINKAAEALGDNDRCERFGDGFRIVRAEKKDA